jgi:hypothetical protein
MLKYFELEKLYKELKEYFECAAPGKFDYQKYCQGEDGWSVKKHDGGGK